ncbi:MBL fold metallo-hydrolase [Mycobacterium sp. 236(2023)]|uniref:MBL fold metallo-hydrolase n=1 Tax=Mycobacterium sp. 236(2023) TaxID=3038163 RepID=UPI0024155A88|nr:MBL fold metallo-hydrolase [Mycobacterium sp. 236(2023)]MDG4667258.1 MBL fold metallo-hydrolase [Mycobacterium sp. 236(2023)]
MAVAGIGGVTAYVKRDWIIDRAIRSQLAESEQYAFGADDRSLRILLCGTGSPEASASAQACTMVSAGGRLFVFDAGEGATRSLVNSGVPVHEIEQVFITHYHSDHFNGLGTLVNYGWIWGRSEPLPVTGPEGTIAVIDALNSVYALDNGYRADNMSDLSSNKSGGQAVPADIHFPDNARSVRVYDRDGVTIDAHLVVHDPVKPAQGYVITYGGKKVFISGDTTVSQLNMPAMQDADLVVHEAYASHMVRRAIPIMRGMGNEYDAMVAERTIDYHADTIALAQQAEDAGVEHLALTHLTPYPDGFVARRLFTQGMSDHYSGEITVGEDGMVLTP